MTFLKSAGLSSRCASRALRTSAPYATRAPKDSRPALSKAKDAATAATVAASAQTPDLRTSGTEKHSLALPASHLGASDYDEDEDEDDDRTSEKDAAREDIDYEKEVVGSVVRR